MSLELQIRVTSEPALAGSDCWVEYILSNRGEEAALLPNPAPRYDAVPLFYVRGMGEKIVITPKGGEVAETITIEPAAAEEWAFNLGAMVKLTPGAYEMIAVLDPQGLNVVSNRVEFRVEGVEPREVTLTPHGLPEPRRVYCTWIRGNLAQGSYWEQAFDEKDEVDQPPFQRDAAVKLLDLPPDGWEVWTPHCGIHVDEPEPVHWLFYRSGQTVVGTGPRLKEPLTVELPANAGPLLGPPVMGAMHRADLFYNAGRSGIVVARFTDPYVTPDEAPGIVARGDLPVVPDAIQITIDPPELKTDRRHVVVADVRHDGFSLEHATLDAAGVLSPFRSYVWKVERPPTAIPGFRPAVRVRADGALLVRIVTGDVNEARRGYVFDVTLDAALSEPKPFAFHEVELPAPVVEARACWSHQDAVAVWWLGDGSVAASNGGDLRIARRDVPPTASRELVGLGRGVYLLEVGPLGFQFHLL